MSGEGSSVAPPTSTTPSPSSLPPSVTPYISPSAGVRFPLYATIQGVNSPLLYSPTLFGQSMLPWRPLTAPPSSSSGAKPSTAVSASPTLPLSSTSHPPTSTVVTGYTASFAQLPGFMYPLNMPLVMADGGKKAGEASSASSGAGGGVKRRNDPLTDGGEDTKRPRVATATPPIQSTSSSPSPQPPLVRPTPHRSPVIKYNLLPYNIAGGAAMVAGGPGQQTQPTTLTPTVILSLTPHTSTKLTPNSSLLTASPNAPSTITMATSSTPPVLPSSLAPPVPSLPFPPNLFITLLRCFGPIPPHSAIPGSQLLTSDLLSDLYRSSYHTTSELSGNLSPESCALLTISYLSSLRRGERICMESLHTMLKYARTGELEWLQYYKRHKKMSESTFVQSQLMHLSRIAVYPALGRVRVMISSEHLGQGIALTMQNLAQLVAVSTEALPDFVVVLAVRANAGVEFCVLVLEPLLSQLLLRQQRSKARRVLQGVGKRLSSLGGQGDRESSAPPVEVKIERKLLLALRRAQRRLKGAVHVPFLEHGNDSMTVSPSEAESMAPSAPHVIEHRPRGPFQEQYSVAMHLLQRISGGTSVKLENFRNVDFCVLCPPEEESFVRETMREVERSGLVGLVAEGEEEKEEGGPEQGQDGVEERVIRCSEEDSHKFLKFLNRVHSSQETLFLVVVEAADIACSLAVGAVDDASHNSHCYGNCCYGEHKILLGQSNVVMLYVTSRPYRLLTNRFLVSPANEIHWPQKPVNSSGGGGGEGVEFNCVAGLLGATVKGAWSGGVVMGEDERMEEEFHHITSHLCPQANLLQIRHQLLLNDYVTALASHAHSTSSAHPDTRAIVQCLVHEPVTNGRGHGAMLLIRSHDHHMGREFHSQLRAARDALGLQYRFEILLDAGREGLKLSPHFSRRVTSGSLSNGHTGSGCYSNGGQDNGSEGDGGIHDNSCRGNSDHVTYSDLENVPCVVVMTGEERPHVNLPSSLRWVDLRLLYPTDITRSSYEAELAWMNGHFPPSPPPPLPPSLADSSSSQHLRRGKNYGSSDKAGGSHSDSEEVFSESHDARPHPLLRLHSSSSSRRSSINDLVTTVTLGEREGVGRERAGVVEWHPKASEDLEQQEKETPLSSEAQDEGEEEGEGEEGEEEEEEGQDGDDVIDVSELATQTPPTAPMTTTVVIDPPEDQMHTHGEGGTWSYPHSAVLPNHWNSMGTVEGGEEGAGESKERHRSSETEQPEVQLFAGLSDTDSDSDDEREALPLTRTCLLPRPYYHIWTSRNPQQALLLPPAIGMEWASPSKHSRSSAQTSSSAGVATSNGSSSTSPASSGSERTRRPPLFDPDPAHQTGYYRRWTKPSNVTVKKMLDMLLRATISGMKRRYLLTGPSQAGKSGAWRLLVRILHDHLKSSHTVVVENPPLQHSIILQDTPTSGGTHSCVVAPGYLKQLYKELLENEDRKPFSSLPPSPPHQTPPTSSPELTPSTTLTLSPYAIHDSTHSCGSCTANLKRSLYSDYKILSQSFPVSHDRHVTVKWYVPASMTRYCVMDAEKKVLERLCLPSDPGSKAEANRFQEVPIFTPSVGRDSLAPLLNLSHSGFDRLHVVVTVMGELQSFMRVWPGHMIMAFPETDAKGKGMLHCHLKQFLHHTYHQNCQTARLHSKDARLPLPWILLMGDGCVMWRRVGRVDQWRCGDLSLPQVLLALSQGVRASDCAAISIPQWSTALASYSHSPPSPPLPPVPPHLTQYDLNHDFLLLNVAMTTDVHYRPHSYTSQAVDLNLQLFVGGLRTLLRTDLSVVKKHFPERETHSLHSDVTVVAIEVDSIAVSLHDTSAALVDYPGPYLLEHYLRHKSPGLFPGARSPRHPVLMVDHYVDLGPQTFVSFIQSSSLDSEAFLSREEAAVVRFGGLVLYLCEGRVAKQQLRRLTFVPGACLCLVTHSSGSLVGEVGRLDLEERWKFRLRDEYKTACPDNNSFKPLYFLIGHFGQ